MPTFDVVSKVDEQEVDNAVNQAIKELSQRYDFKGSKSEIQWSKGEEIVLVGDDDFKLKAVTDILESKLVKRGISLKSLDFGEVEDASGGLRRQVIKVKQGIEQERSKEIVKFIKSTKIKVQAQIQGEQLRITGKKRDDLQEIIGVLKEKDFDLALQFVNMRD